MKNSSYKSVPVIASVIGGKSRKAMYLVSPTSLDGSIVYKDKWIPTGWQDKIANERVTIDWEYEKQSLIEFPLSKASEAMIIEVNKGYERGTNRIKSRLVDNKVKQFLQIEDRILVHVPLWLIRNFEQKFTIIKNKQEEEVFENDNKFETIIEETAQESMVRAEFSYRPDLLACTL